MSREAVTVPWCLDQPTFVDKGNKEWLLNSHPLYVGCYFIRIKADFSALNTLGKFLPFCCPLPLLPDAPKLEIQVQPEESHRHRESVTMRCQGVTNPALWSVSWFKDGTQLEEQGTTLTLPEVTRMMKRAVRAPRPPMMWA